MGGPEDRYRLTIGGGQGDGRDGMAYHNGMQFSTYDFDNDVHVRNCGYGQQGGWWYKACHLANLNGPHTIPSRPGVDRAWGRLIWRNDLDGTRVYVPNVEMKVRLNTCITDGSGDSC